MAEALAPKEEMATPAVSSLPFMELLAKDYDLGRRAKAEAAILAVGYGSHQFLKRRKVQTERPYRVAIHSRAQLLVRRVSTCANRHSA